MGAVSIRFRTLLLACLILIISKRRELLLSNTDYKDNVIKINYSLMLSKLTNIFGPGGVPNRHIGCSCCSCCYRFRKMPKALLIRYGKLRNLAYTFVTSFPTDLPS